METKTIKAKPSIALILCIFFLVAYVFCDLKRILVLWWVIKEGFILDSIEVSLSYLGHLFLAVALFKNRNGVTKAIKICAGLVLAYDLVYTINFFNLITLMLLLASAFVFMPVITKNKSSKRLCVISAIITLLIMIGVFFEIFLETRGALELLMLAGAYIMIGRVLSKPIDQKTEIGTTPIMSEKEDLAESLTKLKNLLDNGVITQEEFDAKKKQILGL